MLSWRFFDCAHEGIRTPNLLIRSRISGIIYNLYLSLSRDVRYQTLQTRQSQVKSDLSCSVCRCRDVRSRTVPGLCSMVPLRIAPFITTFEHRSLLRGAIATAISALCVGTLELPSSPGSPALR